MQVTVKVMFIIITCIRTYIYIYIYLEDFAQQYRKCVSVGLAQARPNHGNHTNQQEDVWLISKQNQKQDVVTFHVLPIELRDSNVVFMLQPT